MCGERLECMLVTLWSSVSRHHFAGLLEERQNKDRKQSSLSVRLQPCNSPPPLRSHYKQESYTFRILQLCFLIECCYFKSAVLPFWLLGNRRFSSCAQNDMIRGPAEQGPGGDSEDISVLSCDGGTKKLLTKSILENFSHIMAREKNQYT